MNFFRPGGLNPSIVGAYRLSSGGPLALHCAGHRDLWRRFPGFNANCDPCTTFTGCVPFGDMDANYSNGSSIYHGFTTNLRKRFGNHYEFLASYTWSHAIDDSTDLAIDADAARQLLPGDRSLDVALRPAPSLRLQRRVSDVERSAATALSGRSSATGPSLR